MCNNIFTDISQNKSTSSIERARLLQARKRRRDEYKGKTLRKERRKQFRKIRQPITSDYYKQTLDELYIRRERLTAEMEELINERKQVNDEIGRFTTAFEYMRRQELNAQNEQNN